MICEFDFILFDLTLRLRSAQVQKVTKKIKIKKLRREKPKAELGG